MDGSARVVARSYRSVFALERRIFRIDRVRLNPTGVPVRGVVYVAVIAGLVAALARLPVTGWVLGLLPGVIRTLGLPVVLGALACVARVDGRPLHAAAGAVLAFVVRPRRLWLLEPYHPSRPWRPAAVVFVSSGMESSLGRVRFRGPGAAHLRVAHRRSPHRSARGAVLRVTDGGDENAGQVIVLRDGGVLETRRAP